MNAEEELITANLVLPLIKDLVLPKIEGLIKKFSIKNFDSKIVEANFEEYLSQRYEKFLIIDTLVFPNKQTLFKKLYEPLTLVTKDIAEEDINIKIDNYPDSFLPQYIRVLIEDTAGMGKSTITKKLFLSAIEQNAGIPILIELRQINKDNDFLKEIQYQLSPIGKEIPLDILSKLLKEGEFIFLFDGFDEIAKTDKEFVIKDLHRFVEKANNNYFLITSRSENSLVSFGDFQKFTIKPLKKKQAYSLIRKYDQYSFKPISEQLILQLNDNNEKTLAEFLSNPFLVSLLYKSFEFKKDIPLKKSQFYRQVYDALFEAHDLSKEGYLKRDKHSNLHIDDFERVLRYVGYLTSIENKVEYDKNYILNIIEKAKKHVPDLSFKSSDYLNDLTETVPLFKVEGNYIKWAHKSLQDYFAAKFIWIDAKQNQDKILTKIFFDNDNHRFYNVLDLFYELDISTFEKTILLWSLEDFEKHSKSSYTQFSNVDKKLVINRIENSYNKKCFIVVTKEEDYEIISKSTKNSAIAHAYYRKKAVGFNIENCHTTYNYFKNPKVVVLSYIETKKNIDTVLKLLSNKMPKIAEYRPHKVDLKTLNELKQDCAYILNDDIQNIINNENAFEITNDLILSDYAFNHDVALKKLAMLRKDLDIKLENELINW